MNELELLDFIIKDKNLSEKDIGNLILNNNIDKNSFLSLKIAPLNKEVLEKGKKIDFWSVLLLAAYYNHGGLFNYVKEGLNLRSEVAFYNGYMGVLNSIKIEKMISEPYVYKWLPEKGLEFILNELNKLNLEDEKNKKYSSYFDNKNFGKSIFKFWLNHGYKNLLDATILPLLNNYTDVHKTLMKEGTIENIIFWTDLINTNKLFILNNFSGTKKLNNARSIFDLVRTNNKNDILIDLLKMENIYEMLVSNGKKGQKESIDKIDFILSNVNSITKDNFIYDLEQASKKYNEHNNELLSLEKENVISYAINKEQYDILNYFNKIGCDFIYKKEEQNKAIGNDKNIDDIYMDFINISEGSSTRSEKALDKFLSELSNNQKIELFNKINIINNNIDTVSNFYPAHTTDKELQKVGANASTTFSMILNSKRNMLLIMLKHGYKLTQKEYGLSYLMFTRYTGLTSEFKNKDIHIEDSLINDFNKLKDYPIEYKNILFENMINFANGLKQNDTQLKYAVMIPIIMGLIAEDKVEIKPNIKNILYNHGKGKVFENYFLSIANYVYKNYSESVLTDANKTDYIKNVILNNQLSSTFTNINQGLSLSAKKPLKFFIQELSKQLDEKDYLEFKEQVVNAPRATPFKKTEIFKIFVEIEKDQISNAMFDKQIDLKAKKRL